MMQVEPLRSTDCATASMAASAANIGASDSSGTQRVMKAPEQEPLQKNSSASFNIVKQAITPIGVKSKSNLLKFLTSAKSGVFQTIGDRIVVPVKVTTPSKDSASSEGSKYKNVSTFRMAVPATTIRNVDHGFKKTSHSNSLALKRPLIQTPAGIKEISSKPIRVARQIQRTPLTSNHLLIKTEPRDARAGFEATRVNKFIKSINRSVLNPIKTNHQDTTLSTTVNQSEPFPTIKRSSFRLDEEDDELTSLSWLSSDNKDLLRTIRKCNPDDPGIGLSSDENDEDENLNNKKLIFTASSPINPQVSNPRAYKTFGHFRHCIFILSNSCVILK